MDRDNCKLAAGLVSDNYINQGSQALSSRRRLIKSLLSQRRLPDQGWDDDTIELFIRVIASIRLCKAIFTGGQTLHV